eukprot:TRINITY_DN3616_c0_g2_i10.p1 TRINITY_DN3616_c0_g2~~TRINITY_DN3616_c0_g2_i10.p1  ORF type:complete len:229 (-),score=48.39 TRINITY_DN3616_c0_g2_i10:894-1529(-)
MDEPGILVSSNRKQWYQRRVREEQNNQVSGLSAQGMTDCFENPKKQNCQHGQNLEQFYTNLIQQGTTGPNPDGLNQLRKHIFFLGLPPEDNNFFFLTERFLPPNYISHGNSQGVFRSITLRGKVWKILLAVKKLDAQRYEALVRKGVSSLKDIIHDDVTRTFMTDELFHKRVRLEVMERVLNAWQHLQEAGGGIGGSGGNSSKSLFLFGSE